MQSSISLFSLGAVALAAFSLPSYRASAQSSGGLLQVFVSSGSYSGGGAIDSIDRNSTNETAYSLSDSYSGAFAGASGNASFSGAYATAYGSSPGATHDNPRTGGQSGFTALDREYFTLTTPTDPVGTYRNVRVTAHASGSVAYAPADQAGGHYSVDVNVPGGGGAVSYGIIAGGGSSTVGTPVPPTFTFETTIQVGVPFPLDCSVDVGAGGDSQYPDSSGPSSASASARVWHGLVELVDENGAALEYTLESRSGVGKGQNIAANEPYSDFALTNDTAVAPGSHGTRLSLLDGIASVQTSLRGTFFGAIEDAVIKQVSDSLDFVGTGSDPVVLQLNYDPAAVQSGGLVEGALRLLWRDPATLKLRNAVTGNTGGAPQFVSRAYNPATDFHVGTFGIDTKNHVVWAVVNHNSEFVVGAAPLRVQSIARVNASTIRLEGRGEPEERHRIEASPDLSAGSWITVATLPADENGAFAYDDTDATGTQRFYRIAYP